MENRKPTISAIVIAWQGEEFLEVCLSSLLEDLNSLENDLSYEVIVVDNGSTDRSKQIITSEFPEVKLIKNKKNFGFAKGVNIGLKAASGDYLYILNQDLRFNKGTISALLTRLKSEPELGMIGPAYLSNSGELLSSARSFPQPKHIIYDFLLLSRLFPRDKEFSGWRMGWFDHKTDAYVDQPMGAVMLIPRAVLDQVGYLDELFPLFFNDVDYCHRMQIAGFKRLYYPQAKVYHHVGGSTKKIPITKRVKSHSSILRYFLKYAKWYDLPVVLLSGLLLFAGLLVMLPFDILRSVNKK